MMKDILNRLIMDNKGPWKDYATETRERCRSVCEAVAAEILFTITGEHPEAIDSLSAEYSFDDKISIYVTFYGKATHTAEQIAAGFQELAGVAVHVKVWEVATEWGQE